MARKDGKKGISLVVDKQTHIKIKVEAAKNERTVAIQAEKALKEHYSKKS